MNKPKYKKRYRIRHPQKVKVAALQYRESHEVSELARKKRWREKHKGQIAEYNRRYFKNHQAALTRKRRELRHREIINESGHVYVTREA